MQIDENQLLKGLIKAFETNKAANRPTSQQADLFNTNKVEAEAKPADAILHWHEATVAWLSAATEWNRTVVFPDSEWYPKALEDLSKPPKVLFCEGNLHALDLPSLAMVGSRNASHTGLDLAESFAREMTERGWSIVSGLAEGIDGAAHEGCLLAHGQTVAVLGGATDRIYPKHHHGLANRIMAADGLIVSEYPPGTQPRPMFFPQRNRIIAALSTGVLVVEAASKSGSLITARQASELGRAVMALPGSVHSTHSKGCHEMIKQGAMLVETAQEIETELRAVLPAAKAAKLLGTSRKKVASVKSRANLSAYPLAGAISHHPEHVDEIAARAQMSVESVLACLTEMELEGLVSCEPGNRWLLRSAA